MAENLNVLKNFNRSVTHNKTIKQSGTWFTGLTDQCVYGFKCTWLYYVSECLIVGIMEQIAHVIPNYGTLYDTLNMKHVLVHSVMESIMIY
jgi:hypothetical protein